METNSPLLVHLNACLHLLILLFCFIRMQVYKFTCIRAHLISKEVKYYRIFTIKLKMYIVPRNVHVIDNSSK